MRGFTLVEVLVALVVMAVGMLGIAALYAEGLRASRSAISRITAVTLAADMADRIRANPAARLAYDGAGPGVDQGCVNGADDCSPDELAEDDWFHWYGDVLARLPPGSDATVAVDAPPPPAATTYAITLRWPEVGQDVPVVYTLTVQL
jgi:type IV pilus assembly protein PilV